MKNKISSFYRCIFMILFGSFLTACSSHPTEAEVASPGPVRATSPAKTVGIETQQVAAEQKADAVIELRFKKSAAKLSEQQREDLKKLLTEAKAKGTISEVQVITWADAEYPSVHTRKLSSAERNLAKQRNGAIESYLKSQQNDIKVKTYSMAERANALQEFIGTSEARIKKSLELSGIPTTDTSVKSPSKASRSIVMVLTNEKE